MGTTNAAMPPTEEIQSGRHGVKLPAASLAAEYHGQSPIHAVAYSCILFLFLKYVLVYFNIGNLALSSFYLCSDERFDVLALVKKNWDAGRNKSTNSGVKIGRLSA
jgi:hypothetical protein